MYVCGNRTRWIFTNDKPGTNENCTSGSLATRFTAAHAAALFQHAYSYSSSTLAPAATQQGKLCEGGEG